MEAQNAYNGRNKGQPEVDIDSYNIKKEMSNCKTNRPSNQ